MESDETRPSDGNDIARQFSEKAFFLLVALAGLLYAFFIWHNSFVVQGERCFSLFDDAMISMRFAKNFAAGHGLTWNVGQPPVEGYTNFLWTMFMALIHLLPISPTKTSLLVMAAGVIILLTNLLVVRRITSRFFTNDPIVAFVPLVLTAFYYPIIYWTLRGMEVGALMLFLNAGVLFAFRLREKWSNGDYAWLTVMMVAAFLTRTDMVIPAGVITAFALLSGWKSGQRIKLAALPGLLFLVMVGQTYFRLHYYGDSLPNTYYLKVTGVSPYERLSRGLLVLVEVAAYHFWPVLLLLGAGAIRGFRKFFNSECLFLLILIGGQICYSIYVGGDAWEWTHFANRYLTIITPLLFILVAYSMQALLKDHRRLALRLAPFLGVGLFAEAVFYLATGQPFPAATLVVVGLFLVAGGVVLGFRASQETNRTAVIVSITALVSVAMNFLGYSCWMMKKNNGVLIAQESDQVMIGLRYKRILPKDTVLAVVWAGTVPYFSELPCVDLLGKVDPVVAKSKPRGPFHPGHNKWNYEHSIGELQPDLVLSLWLPTNSDWAVIQNAGYTRVGGLWVSKSCRARISEDVLKKTTEPITPEGL